MNVFELFGSDKPRKNLKESSEISIVYESSDMCKVCGQTPCNCTNISESTVNEFAIDKNDAGDGRSKLIGAIAQLLQANKKVDFYVPGIRGHVSGIGGQGDWVTLKRWNKPHSKINYSLDLDSSDDNRFALKMIRPDYYQVVQKNELSEGTVDRRIARTQALIQDYHKRAKASANDIKKNHYLAMADQLTAELQSLIDDASEHERAGNEIAQHDAEPSATWNRGGLGVTESEQSDLRKLQQQWWVALPAIMKQAGIDYHPVKELSRDYYPTLGWIKIPGEQFTTFDVNANPKGDAAKINISVDVDTSNEFYRTSQPERAAKLNAFAEKIAQALGGTAAEHMTGERRNRPGVSHITATVQLPKEPAEWQNPSRSYDPKARFLNTPGERARQGRAARSGFPDSYGGDASNYRLEGVAEAEEQVNEFAPGNDDDNGGEEDALFRFAQMWYSAPDVATQQKVEQALAKAGWGIGELESEEGGAYVMRVGDNEGDSYIGWSEEQLADISEGTTKTDDYVDPEEADYGDEYQAMVKRVGQKAKQQELAKKHSDEDLTESFLYAMKKSGYDIM